MLTVKQPDKMDFLHSPIPLFERKQTLGKPPVFRPEFTPSAVGAGVITVTVDPDGSGPLLPESDTVVLTSFDLVIDARNSITLPSGSKAAPLMWNDNWDNGQVYGPDDTGSEHEPIWDRDYYPYLRSPLTQADPDLMSTFITILPADLPGTFELVFGNGVQLWTDNLKSDVILGVTPYTAETIPKSFYTEGVITGSCDITLEYRYNGRLIDEETLRADVVWLKAVQGGKQKVIYANGQNITFEVVGLPSEYTCQWDLNGDGVHNNGDWEDMNTSTAVVKYSPTASEPGNVFLPEERKDFTSDEEYMANRRKEYAVTVKLTGGYVLPLMFGTIRVAQSTYQGTALKGELKNGENHDDPAVIARRRTEVAKLAALPPMDALLPSGDYSAASLDKTYGTDFVGTGNNFIQYATDLADLGLCAAGGTGSSRKVFATMISETAYVKKLKKEDLESIALHEVRHAYQNLWMRGGKPNWVTLEASLPSNSMESIMEADAYCVSLNANGSWRFVLEKLPTFVQYYKGIGNVLEPGALEIYDTLTGAKKTAAKAIFQEIYVAIPFIEMKKDGYDWYVKPPE